MRVVAALAKLALALVALAIVGVAAWLWFAPPDLIRVGTGYSAKIVCSNVFIAGRDAEEVLETDVQAPGHPLLGFVSVDVDREAGTVRAALLGLFGESLAVARDGLGCASVPDGDLAAVPAMNAPPASAAADLSALWPQGEAVEPSQDVRIAAILDDPALAGPGMRAIVVVHDGRIIGERYGDGFSATTTLLGWSMSKTVTAGIIGTLIARDRLARGQTGLFPAWEGDGRSEIALSDLLAMSSGLSFNEDYGDVTDVTRMLYLEPDMASFAAAKPLVVGIGQVFSYSSGTTVMLSRIWQDAIGDPATALAWPREALFGPIGMASAVMETDARGTFVGSSYLYATARDWARYGLLLLQEGQWDGVDILPPGYVAWMREEAPTSGGEYGRGQLWLHGPSAGTPAGQHPDAGFDLPDDAFWMLGHDGQSTAIIPSKNLVVVRMGLTPSKLGYKSQALVEALAKAVE